MCNYLHILSKYKMIFQLLSSELLLFFWRGNPLSLVHIWKHLGAGLFFSGYLEKGQLDNSPSLCAFFAKLFRASSVKFSDDLLYFPPPTSKVNSLYLILIKIENTLHSSVALQLFKT